MKGAIMLEAIYTRQSVDKKDSISIETQMEICKREVKGGKHKVYSDKGFSGKNTDRPKFQELMRDIEQGLIKRVIVYKLDRISRSVIDFANLMEFVEQYGVEFVSTAEKFDTSTPMGRAMLHICIVFAQLERETIQERVTDSHYSRCEKGFHACGRASRGFELVKTVFNGVNTKMLVEKPGEIEYIKLAFELFEPPTASQGDVLRYFLKRGILVEGKLLTRSDLSYMCRNPIYVKADLAIYEFFKNQGTHIVNDLSEFNGINGCYLYNKRGAPYTGKSGDFKDKILVIAPHEGVISSERWLKCRKKLMNKTPIGNGSRQKAKHTWLSGKIKCGLCGYTLSPTSAEGKKYFRCRKQNDSLSCTGCGTLRVWEVEASIYGEMRERMTEWQTLTGNNSEKANPKLTALQVEQARLEGEIETLIGSLIGANPTLLSYANTKVEEMDAQLQTLVSEIADLSIKTMSEKQAKQISNHLDNWETISFDDRRVTIDSLISKIHATSQSMTVDWKI